MTTEVTTYRYVRFALCCLLAGLAISVTAETISSREFQTSISSYYYTSAGPVFTAVLCAMGVCLVVLRGYTDAEDTVFNLAGLSAPMVGFVPTPEVGEQIDKAAIVNNAWSYLAVMAIGWVVVLIFGLRKRAVAGAWPSRWAAIGLASVAAAWVVGVGWLLIDQDSFATKAHGLAAVFTFAPFALGVVLNTDWGVRKIAREADKARTRLDRTYWALVAAMAVLLVAGIALGLAGWTYWLLATEVSLLVCFTIFWVIQSFDLMDPQRDSLTTRPGDPLTGSR
ncbi:ABC-type Co2+ transport system permease subunit [Nocardioides luteus]|uniref:DUF998 domain-containing protein n=1 Tax=Nocardioides luteus TaxID=1844 RepID=A0ABQ5SXZ3_9ACTN|nr:hypothetical protein [Nocardioides luteus]MDR7312804.1 ABC-type Co2+ transport system permease subunit [Nocardioides luteus]GGR47656.1 hypothetical protein GCM10010197_11930 [Nocardioides luteus]GLJ69057.1 hypothetical protein GCM10017579_30930 [Nocardioides luteus]